MWLGWEAEMRFAEARKWTTCEGIPRLEDGLAWMRVRQPLAQPQRPTVTGGRWEAHG